MGLMSAKASARPLSRNHLNESRWMAMRSGSGRTSSRLAKEKRSGLLDRAGNGLLLPSTGDRWAVGAVWSAGRVGRSVGSSVWQTDCCSLLVRSVLRCCWTAGHVPGTGPLGSGPLLRYGAGGDPARTTAGAVDRWSGTTGAEARHIGPSEPRGWRERRGTATA